MGLEVDVFLEQLEDDDGVRQQEAGGTAKSLGLCGE